MSRFKLLFASVAAIAVGAASQSLAAAPNAGAATGVAADAAAVQPSPSGADVIVTATKRETRLQETPVAETAITAPQIEANHIISLQDVAISVPNLTYTQFSTQESYFSIRGTLINNNAAGWDDAIATFVDDVPTTGLGDVNPDLFDLASIEVLRGPQGTLFGRNATGGAVIIRTQPPSFSFNGKVEATYGSYNLVQLRGLVTGPLSDTLAAKLVVDYQHQDAYINNVFLHDKTNGTDLADVRGQLLWRPNGKFELLLSADYLHDWSGGYPTRLLANFQPVDFPHLSYSPYDTNQAFNGFQHRDIAGLSARATWDGPLGTLTSITGYRYVDAKFPNDIIGDPENELPTVGLVHDTQVSQEIRLASPSDQRLIWVAGIFALHSDKREGGPIGFFFNPNTIAGFFLPDNNYTQFNDQKVATDSVAVFGEATYAFTPELKLTAGLRASYERKSGHSIVTYTLFDPVNLPPGNATYSHSWSAVTPKVTLTFQPNHRIMAYVTAAEGFKSGGYDLSGSGAGVNSATVNAALSHPFNQETVWNYEAGLKMTAFDNRLVFDADVFDDEYHDLQTSQLVVINGVPIPLTSNAGDAKVTGVEVETQLAATDWLTLGVTYAYMDARFTSPNTGFTNNHIPYAPQNQVHLSADIHYPLPGNAGRLAIGADYTYHSKVFFDNGNTAPTFLQRKSIWNGIVNGHIAWDSADDRWKVEAWGKNITGQEPALHAADVTVLFQDAFGGDPGNAALFLVKYYPVRTFGVTVTRKF
ncbi:MAG TPA: TonB-dependent receptor [Caulobacteraceae bacterium]|nr:TonB-dependent receptor [Caulobacteraceae bacterium]